MPLMNHLHHSHLPAVVDEVLLSMPMAVERLDGCQVVGCHCLPCGHGCGQELGDGSENTVEWVHKW